MKIGIDEKKKSLLTALEEALACDPLAWDEEGRIVFGIDNKMGVALFDVEESKTGVSAFIVCILIGKPDPTDPELLYAVLSGNYMWGYNGKGMLSIDKETGLLVVQRFFDCRIEPDEFVASFADLVGAARYWRERLEVCSAIDRSTQDELIRV